MSKKRRRPEEEETSYWLSYSDMMAALLLIFILIISFTLMQSKSQYESKQAELDKQQEIIKEAVQKHIDFVYENAEMLESPLSSYSISGVSMSFDRSKIVTVGGITTTGKVYNLLMQTGLCYRGLM